MAEIIQVSIGTEPKQYIASEVLKASILRRTNRPVQFVESWTPADWHPAMSQAPKLKNGTAFNTWRWITPSLFYAGKAIYLDADQVVLSDIGELWDLLPSGKTIGCVCNAVGVFGKRAPEPGKAQTSVMVMDVGRMRAVIERYQPLRRCAHGELSYADLMQAAWLPRDEVQEIDPGWNHFGILNWQTKLIHYSHVASQPYRNPDHPTASVFNDELIAAVKEGFITAETVQRECERGHISAIYGKRCKGAA